MPDAPPQMDPNKASDLANRLLECCNDADLNRFEILTALGMVTAVAFEDVPRNFREGWIKTLRRKTGLTDA